MPLSRAQMPQISILPYKGTQFYPSTQKSQKRPFKRVTRHAPSLKGYLYAYTRLHAHVYIIISPCPYLCIRIPMQLYPYAHIYTCTATYTYLETGICGGMAMCVCMWVYTATSMCRDRCTDTNRGRHGHTALHVYAPGTPLRGKRSGGGCQEQLNVCLIV